MELFARDTRITSVRNLRLVRGRLSFHFEPDFCGRMNVVIDDRSSDHVTFSSDAVLPRGDVYTIADSEGQTMLVRITESEDGHYTAIVLEA